MSNRQDTSLLAMRFSRLGTTGLPVSAVSTGAWTACDPVSIDVQFQYDNGTDVVQKDGAGRLCFVRKRPDNLKHATVKFDLCGGDPRGLELILSGPGVIIGGTTTPSGFGIQVANCTDKPRNGIFVEWFTENYLCNSVDTNDPNSRHFLPKVIANYDGGKWDEAKHQFTFTGICNAGVVQALTQTGMTGSVSASVATAGGPFNDISGFPTDQAFLYGYTTNSGEANILNALVCSGQLGAGYIATPTQ